MTDDSDAALVAAVAHHRDERAFGILYDRHTAYLWRLALRLSAGDAGRAEDIVHDAWVRASERLGTFSAQSLLRTWLAGFVVNVAREYARDGDRAEPINSDVPAPGDAENTGLSRVDIDRALARLPEGFRRVLVLHDVEGFTHDEIGAMLGIDSGTSKSQLSRARHRARTLLASLRDGGS